METKYNEATLNRPEGDRIIDAPFVFTDLEKYSKQLIEEDAWKKNDRNGITVYKTDHLTMVLTWLHKGATIMDNVLDGLVIIQVLEGKVDFSVENARTDLRERQVITLHSGIMHTLKALEDSLILITTKTARCD